MSHIINALSEGTILRGKSYQYRIVKVLGQGSFGITYLGEIVPNGGVNVSGLKLKVAIKEFFMKSVNGRESSVVTIGGGQTFFSEYRIKFLREARNLAKMEHRNIVNVLETFEQNNTVYYSMEYIDGGSLDEYIQSQGHLTEQEAIWTTREIGAALSYMHSLRMLHLDLKPLNVMRKADGSIILIDFGLSKQYDVNGEPETSTKVESGTPGYAPLEQANYQDGHEFPVTMDIYALGATLYKMLTGKRPPLASEILNEGFPYYEIEPLHISEGLKQALTSAMAPMKKMRPQSVSEFLRLLPTVKRPTYSYSSTQKTYHTQSSEGTVVDSEYDNPRALQDGMISFNSKTSLIEFVCVIGDRVKSDIKSYKVTITPNRLIATSHFKKQGIVRRTYFLTPPKYNDILTNLSTLRLTTSSLAVNRDAGNDAVELCVKENDVLCIDASTTGNKSQLLGGNVEKACSIIEKTIDINKIVIRKDSPITHKMFFFYSHHKWQVGLALIAIVVIVYLLLQL